MCIFFIKQACLFFLLTTKMNFLFQRDSQGTRYHFLFRQAYTTKIRILLVVFLKICKLITEIISCDENFTILF